MSEHLSGDNLRDLRLDEDRTVTVADDGDFELTSGIETVEQSVGISAGAAVRPLIGEPVSGTLYEDIRQEIEEALEDDPQIETVNRASVTEVNTATGEVTVEVFTEYNNSFEMEIPTDTVT